MFLAAPCAAVAEVGFRSGHVDAAMRATHHRFGVAHVGRSRRPALAAAARLLAAAATARQQAGGDQHGQNHYEPEQDLPHYSTPLKQYVEHEAAEIGRAHV